MTVREFFLPDLGEGLTESELVSWRVAVGDTVKLNQVLAEVETAKALVELPSPFAGVVQALYAEPGSTVAVGARIVGIEVHDAATADAATADAPTPDASEADPSATGPTTADPETTDAQTTNTAPSDAAEPASSVGPTPSAAPAREPVLVGYGPPVEGDAHPKRRPRARVVEEPPDAAAPDAAPVRGPVDVAPGDADRGAARAPTSRPRSTPPVRALARELDVDLERVTGTGEHGIATRDDVLAHAAASGSDAASRPKRPRPSEPQPSAARETGPPRETRTPIRGVRRRTAEAMVASAFSAPHATEFLTVDVTPTMELIERLRQSHAFADRRLTILTVVAKALCIAVARTPSVNSRWDGDAQEIVQFSYVNLGIAAATPRGLLVPNIRDAERLPLADLADALGALIESAKQGRSSTADMRDGTISITNIGVFGIDAGTPILNPGEAVILAIGAVRRMPWEYRDDIALRQVMTLSLSFDHRLVDGEQASRFLADIGAILADPGILLTMVC